PGPLRLSWSHSGDRVVVAVTPGTEVGVDVERIVPHARETAERVLREPERAVLAALPEPRRPAGFVRYWTRKEALLKATGDGLAVPPALLHVTAPDAPPRLLSWSGPDRPDRKSTRLNSSHVKISYAVFCLKKKKDIQNR